MIKIIKPGTRTVYIYAFSCINCGCEWEASEDDPATDWRYSNHEIKYEMRCPCCENGPYSGVFIREEEEELI